MGQKEEEERIAFREALAKKNAKLAAVQAVGTKIANMEESSKPPPEGHNTVVEAFLIRNPVDIVHDKRLRALPWEYQKMIINRGDFIGVRDITAAMGIRITDALSIPRDQIPAHCL